MRLEIKNFDFWERTLRSMPRQTQKTGERILKKSANVIEKKSKEEAPVDKGTMRQSISSRLSDNKTKVIIEPTDPKAKFVHDGTGRYSNSGKDFGVSRWNRVRNNWLPQFPSRDKMEAFFATLNKRGFKMSIKPDKFMKRGKERSETQIRHIQNTEIKKLVNKL